MQKIKVLDKEFELSIPAENIQKAVKELAEKINTEYKGKEVIFVGILNGAFMFAGDILKHINLDCKITFLKMASYQGTKSSGKVKQLIGFNEDLKGKTVIILEDIIDRGLTIEVLLEMIKEKEPAEIKIATLLYKPAAYKKDIPIDYIGIEIPNDFIVGYGLDYDGFGRNYADIYKISE